MAGRGGNEFAMGKTQASIMVRSGFKIVAFLSLARTLLNETVLALDWTVTIDCYSLHTGIDCYG